MSSTSCVQDFQGISVGVNCWVKGCSNGHFYSILPHWAPKWSYQFAHSPVVDENCFLTSLSHFILLDFEVFTVWCGNYILCTSQMYNTGAQEYLPCLSSQFFFSAGVSPPPTRRPPWPPLADWGLSQAMPPIAPCASTLQPWELRRWLTPQPDCELPMQGPCLQGHLAGCGEHKGATECAPRRHFSSTQDKGLFFQNSTECPLGMGAAHISWHLGPQKPTTWPVVFIPTWLVPLIMAPWKDKPASCSVTLCLVQSRYALIVYEMVSI